MGVVQGVLYIDDVDQAAALLKPARIDVIRRMAVDTTCSEIGAVLGQSPQSVNYHVKALEQAGLVERVSERRVRGTVEGIYRAKARAYWLSPRLVGRVGRGRRSRDQASLGYLIALAEEVQEDVGRLASSEVDHEIPSLGMDAHIELANPETRGAFMQEVQRLFQELATKYGATGKRVNPAETFRIALACYPNTGEGPDD